MIITSDKNNNLFQISSSDTHFLKIVSLFYMNKFNWLD